MVYKIKVGWVILKILLIVNIFMISFLKYLE